MKVKVIADDCTGCGLCLEAAPEIFEMDGDVAVAKAEEVPAGEEENTKTAAEDCPSEAIVVE